MKILCEAVSFGFGPASKLLSLSEELSKRYSLDLIGSGCSFALLSKTNVFDKKILCDTSNYSEILGAISFSDYDLVISVMNPVFGRVALEQKCKLVVVDSLFHIWDTIDPVWLDCNLLIVQAFAKEQSELKKYHLPNARMVGPIVSTQIPRKNSNAKSNILINFGGADYPYVSDFKNIVFFIRKIIKQLVGIPGFENKTVSIGPRCLPELKDLEGLGVHINTFSHNDFLQQLSQANVLLTIPGLTTVFEAFHISIPTLFLPPLNYSQLLNSRVIYSKGASLSKVGWDNCFPENSSEKLPEAAGVRYVESLIKGALQNQEVFSSVTKNYIEPLHDSSALQFISNKQNQFYKSLGGCGTYKAVKLIEEMLLHG